MYTNPGKDSNMTSPSAATKRRAAAREHPIIEEINFLERI